MSAKDPGLYEEPSSKCTAQSDPDVFRVQLDCQVSGPMPGFGLPGWVGAGRQVIWRCLPGRHTSIGLNMACCDSSEVKKANKGRVEDRKYDRYCVNGCCSPSPPGGYFPEFCQCCTHPDETPDPQYLAEPQH